MLSAKCRRAWTAGRALLSHGIQRQGGGATVQREAVLLDNASDFGLLAYIDVRPVVLSF